MHPSLSALTFGVEFEVILPLTTDRARVDVARANAVAMFRQLTGLPTHNGRHGAPVSAWKVVDDGSLRAGHHQFGIEFISPVLSNEAGLDQVRKATAAFVRMGATVNASCGFHVHVGARGEGLSFFKTLVKLYARYEDVLDTFMPASRRGNDATYCKSVKLGAPAIDNCSSVADIAMTLARASRAAGVRYHKVNLEAYSKHNTVEFRQHAGTVDGVKATNWIVKCLRMVAAAKQGKTGEGTMMALETVNLAIKTRAVIEMCSRSEGSTIREICERFGFSTVSVKRHARLAGVAFTQRGQRYFVDARVPATTGNAEPLTVEGLANVLEETAEERAFFAGRQQALA